MSSPSSLSPDRPQFDPKEDLFGYAPFAQQLARSIASASPTDGIVLAIYGPWGSGKSSVLNFIDHYLNQVQTTPLVVVRFNPWWFSGEEGLVRHFFDQLQLVLASKAGALAKKLKGKISEFADTIANIPGANFIGIGGKDVQEVAKNVSAGLRGRGNDVILLKEEIAEALKQHKQSILVIIDDIDRLTAEEIRQLFRAIKAVADFPRIVYLLAFDKEVVAAALGTTEGVVGATYLEKIVQVPFDLPALEQESLGRMFFSKLNTILADTPERDFDSAYWTNVYADGLHAFFNTPRDVVRLINSLSVTYPAVKGEVNPIDFIAVEGIRVFEPALYELMRRKASWFLGERRGDSREDGEATNKQWKAAITENRRLQVEHLVYRLFPRTSTIGYGSDWESDWRKQKRICSASIFPVYFRLTIPLGEISSAEIEGLLSSLKDQDQLQAILLGYAASTAGPVRIRGLMSRLEDYLEEDIPSTEVPTFLTVLFDVGDVLAAADDSPPGFMSFGADLSVGRVILGLLRRLDRADRFKALSEASKKGAALATIVREISILGQMQGKDSTGPTPPKEEWLLTASQLKQLESLAATRIAKAAKDGTLADTFRLPTLLYRWSEWGQEAEVKAWAASRLTPELVASFLAPLLSRTRSQVVGEAAVREEPRLSPASLRPFVDPEEVAQVVTLVDLSRLNAKERLAVEQFKLEYEAEKRGERYDED